MITTHRKVLSETMILDGSIQSLLSSKEQRNLANKSKQEKCSGRIQTVEVGMRIRATGDHQQVARTMILHGFKQFPLS